LIIHIDSEQSDTLEACAAKAAQIATALGINVSFYFNRVGFFVKPNEPVLSVVARMKTRG